ncbi:MAG: glycosyltransferase [Armatimonadetes bacterium]|nr:glycosyltransferase [Armatimonadota bacterium]
MARSDVAASVVLYKPDSAQIERVRRLAAMFPVVVVADNSEPQLEPIDGLEWVAMGENKGVAAGLNACAKRASELGYKWLLTLDQDTELEPADWSGYLAAFNAFGDKANTAVIAPRFNLQDPLEPGDGPVRDLEIVMTSANLLNLEVWKKMGGFTEELFIDEVDHEFCLRCRLAGHRVVRLIDAHIAHRPGKVLTVMTRRGAIALDWEPPNRLYYIARNYWFVKRRFGKEFPGVIASRRGLLLAKFREWLRYHPSDIAGAYQLIRGTLHGVLGRFGR